MTGNGVAYPTQQQRIQAKLADPRTADALERLLDKLDVVAFGVDAIDSLLSRSTEVADSLAQSIEEIKSIQGTGHTASDFVTSLPQLARAGTQVATASQKPGFQNLLESGLIDQLGDPQTIANIQTVLGKMEIAAFALNAIDGFVKRGDEITDSLRDGLQDAVATVGTIDFAKLKPLLELLDHVPALLQSGVLEQLPQLTQLAGVLLNSGLVKPESLAAFTEAGHLMSESYHAAKSAPPRTTSLFGLLRALSDPDVNRSVTLALEFAKQYGKRIA
jgi:uncharacterized protein YjgD (DUF1641 family)